MCPALGHIVVSGHVNHEEVDTRSAGRSRGADRVSQLASSLTRRARMPPNPSRPHKSRPWGVRNSRSKSWAGTRSRHRQQREDLTAVVVHTDRYQGEVRGGTRRRGRSDRGVELDRPCRARRCESGSALRRPGRWTPCRRCRPPPRLAQQVTDPVSSTKASRSLTGSEFVATSTASSGRASTSARAVRADSSGPSLTAASMAPRAAASSLVQVSSQPPEASRPGRAAPAVIELSDSTEA